MSSNAQSTVGRQAGGAPQSTVGRQAGGEVQSDESLAWIDAGGGYQLSLQGEKLVCKNAKGKVLSAVPKDVRDGDVAEQLIALREWLETHRAECRETVETWMLRSLPVPRHVLAQVFPDPAWKTLLENAIVAPMAADGAPDLLSAGFIKAADAEKGLGIVDLDGESRWLAGETVALPHPILLDDLNDFRTLAAELALSQGLSQLFRETFARAKIVDAESESVGDFDGGEFDLLMQALNQCRKLGYRVRGSNAICRVFEQGRIVEARYWVGDGDPQYETETGQLVFVDGHDASLKLGEVGPIAWSEGMRMASAIYAARKVEKEESDNA